MKLLAYILIIIALAIGAASATNAYLWDLPADPSRDAEVFRDGDHPDGTARYLELAANAGNIDGAPVARASTLSMPVELTPELVGELREAGVTHVRVKKFSFAKWRGLPWFAGCMAVLIGGGLLVKRETARELRAVRDADDADALSPAAAIGEIRDALTRVNNAIGQAGGAGEQNALIVSAFGELQQRSIPAVVDARPRLVAQLGLGKYAEFMDAFSACERQINRAWSAAADGAGEEAEWCTLRAEELLGNVIGKLPEPPPPPAPPPSVTPNPTPPPSSPPPTTRPTPSPGPSSSLPLSGATAAAAIGASPLDLGTRPEAPETAEPDPEPEAPQTGDEALADLGIEFREKPRRTKGVDPYSVHELANEPPIDDDDDAIDTLDDLKGLDDDDDRPSGPKIDF